MTDLEAGQTICRMLEELPFYSNEARALQAAVVALYERSNRVTHEEITIERQDHIHRGCVKKLHPKS